MNTNPCGQPFLPVKSCQTIFQFYSFQTEKYDCNYKPIEKNWINISWISAMQKPGKCEMTLKCYGIMHLVSNCLLLFSIRVWESPLKNMKTVNLVLILLEATNDGFRYTRHHELYAIMMSEIPNDLFPQERFLNYFRNLYCDVDEMFPVKTTLYEYTYFCLNFGFGLLSY